MTRISVLGAGAYGTSLACAFGNDDHQVVLWGRSSDHVDQIVTSRENSKYLPGCILPQSLQVTSDLAFATAEAEVILLAVPAQQTRNLMQSLAPMGISTPLVLCAKGIETDTGYLQSDLVLDCDPKAQLAAISGPSFASEIAEGLPTAMTLAYAHEDTNLDLQNLLRCKSIRFYRSSDIRGVQIAGALKNVLAIGCGIVIGAGLGENARAALLTRGISEVNRLALEMGAKPETLIGLSGLGDIMLSCTSLKSRNFSYGHQIGQGKSHDTTKTVEGIATSKAVLDLGEKLNVELPICSVILGVLSKSETVSDAMAKLMARPVRPEI